MSKSAKIGGWIKIHRIMQGWEFYTNPIIKSVFLHILLNANHKTGSWRGYDIQPGQLITGRKEIARATGLSERQVRTSINALQNAQQIAVKTTNKFSLVTVMNWDVYNGDDDESTNKTPTKRRQNDQQNATNKNNKNNKKVRINAHTRDDLDQSYSLMLKRADEIRDWMHQSETWQNTLMMQLPRERKMTFQELKDHIDKFIEHIKSTGEVSDLTNAQRHFVHWLKRNQTPNGSIGDVRVNGPDMSAPVFQFRKPKQ